MVSPPVLPPSNTRSRPRPGAQNGTGKGPILQAVARNVIRFGVKRGRTKNTGLRMQTSKCMNVSNLFRADRTPGVDPKKRGSAMLPLSTNPAEDLEEELHRNLSLR